MTHARHWLLRLSPVLATGLCLAAGPAAAAPGVAGADSAGPPVPRPGWVDQNRDGRHDGFQDADGDGVNDVNGHAYTHRFAWADADGDRLNDRFRDADGDGVNDLDAGFRDSDGDGRDENVLDADNDGRNDVTGLAYGRGRLAGEKYGFVREGEDAAAWVDEDGDGFPDTRRQGREDRFIDRDGDGIADGCWFQDGGFRHRWGSGGGAGPGGGGSGGGHGSGGGGGA